MVEEASGSACHSLGSKDVTTVVDSMTEESVDINRSSTLSQYAKCGNNTTNSSYKEQNPPAVLESGGKHENLDRNDHVIHHSNDDIRDNYEKRDYDASSSRDAIVNKEIINDLRQRNVYNQEFPHLHLQLRSQPDRQAIPVPLKSESSKHSRWNENVIDTILPNLRDLAISSSKSLSLLLSSTDVG